MSKNQLQHAARGNSENKTETNALRERTNDFELRCKIESKIFITESELLERIPISRRTLFHWRKSGKIPFIRLSGRRVLFHWESVQAALLRSQRGGISQGM